MQVEVASEENVTKVEFYVEGELRYTDYSPPFEWKWETWGENSNKHYWFWDLFSIGAKAYYNDGDAAATEWIAVEVFDISNLLPS